jgi:hypothetical protein
MSTNLGNPQTRTVIVTALISAISTIAVSFIGVVPVILTRYQRIPETKSQASWRIEGKVHNGGASNQVRAELFLMKADSSRPTDAAGKFVFDEVPAGQHYWLQVEVDGKSSNRYLIGPSTDPDDLLTSLTGGPSIDYLAIGPVINEQKEGVQR